MFQMNNCVVSTYCVIIVFCTINFPNGWKARTNIYLAKLDEMNEKNKLLSNRNYLN